MIKQKSKNVTGALVISVCLLGLGVGSYYLRDKNIISTLWSADKKSNSNTSSWTLYTNKTHGYSLSFPTSYEIRTQTDKEISQMGVDSVICIGKKLNSNCDIRIVFWENIGNLALGDFVNKNLSLFEITGPLVKYDFNGYDSLFNKNQPGTDIFVKQGQYVYHIVASTASSDKEIGDILTTFKFVTSLTINGNKAITEIQKNGSIQYIQDILKKDGRTGYLEYQSEKGDVVTVFLIEGGFPDNHTTRIDTFLMNVKTGEILVSDMTSNKNVSLKEWGKDVTKRFPE